MPETSYASFCGLFMFSCELQSSGLVYLSGSWAHTGADTWYGTIANTC